MLVIISDLHLTDGSSGGTIGADAFQIFKERINEIAYRASKRADGKYRPIERIDILLLGDVLDIIRSDMWLEYPDIRPWSDLSQAEAADLIEKITQKVLTQNKKALDILRGLQGSSKHRGLESASEASEKLWLPAAPIEPGPNRGLESASASVMPASLQQVQANKQVIWKDIKVKIHYMVGNHDWFYHLKGERYNAIRQQIIDAMGLANSADQPFPHEPEESPELLQIMKDHQVFARHGDIYDPFNYEGNRDASSLGDAIVIELLNRFPKEVQNKLGDVLPPHFIEGLKELDNVRPNLYVPFWISGLLNRTVSSRYVRQQVKDLWNELVKDFLNLDFVRSRDKSFRFDDVDILQYGLKITTHLSFNRLNNLIIKFKRRLESLDPSYAKNALNEKAFLTHQANYIVYGHTHNFEIVPLHVYLSATKGRVEQLYINSGTWRSVHDLVPFNKQAKQFTNYKVMTYLIFYKDQERKGRGFEIWNGSLGDWKQE